ncbi:MAG TPA: radical SAM protein [Candidatus Omnitrophota bacterium]|nr:radical SAM protein [Candidatus Omnitrophota bacterium]HRZ14334.1 radical SAM protein [Candidatus Omnitrophota bacterium]
MHTPPFELGPIRPVDEAESLLIRTTRGCPWNRCAFCVNYKDMQFSLRSLDEIKRDIAAAAQYYAGETFETCFLQDGDSFLMKTAELVELLSFLKTTFPTLKRISSYGRAQTMIRKSAQEMQAICLAGLTKLYCGMESGSDTVLKKVNKGVTAADIAAAGRRAKEAGMSISEFIILGLGGQELWEEHARETAGVLSGINPHFIRVLTIGVKPGSGLERQMEAGEYTLQTEKNIIEEQRLLIENLNGITSHYANHHAVDLLMEARGQFPRDKPRLLAIMDRYLSLPEEDRLNFTLGKRLGIYQQLDDMNSAQLHKQVAARLRTLRADYPGRLEEIFHDLRAQIV